MHIVALPVLKYPAAHESCCPGFGQYDAAAHELQLSEPAAAYSPASQATGAESVLGHSEPAGHCVQLVDPSSAYDPAVHADGAPLTEAHALPAGQIVQLDAPAPLYSPASQSVHCTEPAAANVPATHSTADSCSVGH